MRVQRANDHKEVNMGKCIRWLVLGVLFGGILGFMGGLIPGLLGGTSMDVVRMAEALGLILGGGFGAVAGAIVGGTGAILEAMSRLNRQD
jgi:hypothetical protein